MWYEVEARDFPGGPVVKNPPSNAGDKGSIPGWGTKIPHATGQINPTAKSREKLMHHSEEHERYSMPKVKPNTTKTIFKKLEGGGRGVPKKETTVFL